MTAAPASVSETALPHWDMSTIYPSVDSPELADSVERIVAGIAALETLVASVPASEDGAISGATVTHFDALATTYNDVGTLIWLNYSYLSGFTSVDSRNDVAQAKLSELRMLLVRVAKIDTRMTAWLGGLDVEALIEGSAVAREHAFQVRRAKTNAEHQMSQDEEDLASELTLSGGSAWGKLHDDLTSQILVPFERKPGQLEHLPVSDIRNLQMDPDRDVRKRAFDAEIAAWKLWATPIAAALNGVKGEHGTLARRRSWDEILDQALHQNHIDRATLDAMMSAARNAFPDLRRYLHAKARALGVDRLAWYDLGAPLSASDRVWPWDEGVEFLYEQFGRFSPKMRGLAERAVDERWIDAEPRPGKVGGAFCMGIREDESRVLCNYTPAFDGVSTLAHELGHAYHNLCQADISLWRRESTPMTLAETASTFCETILRKAAIANGTEDEQLTLVEGALQDAVQIAMDITSRFLFEQAVCARRQERELSVEEFNELMLDAQHQTYGDGIDEDQRHPYMWAVKGHYYSPDFAYYNYPYMFGLLFGLGLYAQYEADPDTFRANYDDLLASTGDAEAAELAERFGFDIRSTEFWEGSLNVIREDIDTFVRLVDQKLDRA